MSHLTIGKPALYTAFAFLATFSAACDSTFAPDLTDGQGAYTCKVDPATGECVVVQPTLGADRLVFASSDEFQRYLEPLQNASKEELEAAEARNGFESLRAYLDPMEDTEEAAKAGEGSQEPTGNEARALEKDGVTREDFPVGDAFLSALNNRGEVQIGRSVFKLTHHNVFEVAPENLAVLNEKVPTLSSEAPADGDPRITAHKVESTSFGESSEVAASVASRGGPSFHHVPGVGGHCYVYGGSDYRMHGKSYISNFFIYAEAGVTTEWERKKKFLWWTTWSNTWQSGTLSHTYNSALTFGMWNGPWTPIGPTSGFQGQAGVSKVHQTLSWGFGTGVRMRGNIHARHTVANSQANGSCDTAASA
jgi:hypothetical protein